MASAPKPSSWDELPDEILLQILQLLEPRHISRLRAVSRKLQRFCLDDELWKRCSFEKSSWYRTLEQRREFCVVINEGAETLPGAATGLSLDENSDPNEAGQGSDWSRHRVARYMANWDPTFPGERVSWYDEYVQRHGKISVNWLQIPRLRDRGMEAFIEARGMALYEPYDGNDGLGTQLAVSPLDDGSVCLWDVKGSRGKQGSIVAKSKQDILFIDGPGSQNAKRSKKIDTGVTECVSVDHHRHRAYFAVQSHLIEVDLNRLEVINRDSFEWSITTMSEIHDGAPLTVGTSLGIHLHDFRARSMIKRDIVERLEEAPQWNQNDIYKAIFDPRPLPPYASLSQPTPISILHLPRPGSHSLMSDDIYVSGRFTNILHYDRRKFPSIVGSIYSGALIKSLAALPHPFSTVDNEVRRQGELSPEQVQNSKQGEGRTLIGGGEYKTKGSLELYGLSSSERSSGSVLQNSTMKNRQTASSSSILSVINHGTKIAFTDGSGWLRWFERDGITEVRRHRIGHSDAQERTWLFSPMTSSDDLARKILSTQSRSGTQDRNNNNSNNLMFWTGEKLGMVSFTSKPLFRAQDFEETEEDFEEIPESEEIKREIFSEAMKAALERQANEVKFISSLGLGARE